MSQGVLKKRVLSVLLTTSMVMGLCPSPAWALGELDPAGAGMPVAEEDAGDAATPSDGIAEQDVPDGADSVPDDAPDEGAEGVEQDQSEDEADVTGDDVETPAERQPGPEEDPAFQDEVSDDPSGSDEATHVDGVDAGDEATGEDDAAVNPDEEGATQDEKDADQADPKGEDARKLVAASSNISRSKAKAISVNKAVSAKMADDGNDLWYKFTLDRAGYVSLTWSNDFVNQSDGWRVNLYGDGSSSLASYRFLANHKGSVACGKIGLPAGTYYLRIETYGYADASFAYTVRYVASDTWEREPSDDTKSGATPIVANEEYHGANRGEGDEDWYALTLAEAGPVNLTWTSSSKAEDGGWRVRLYGDAGQSLCDYRFEAGAGDERHVCGRVGLPAGTYFLRAESQGEGDVTYAFTVNHKASGAWEREPSDDDRSGATVISARTKHYGSMRSEDDEDWYRFTLARDSNVSLTWSHKIVGTGDGWRAFLYNAKGKALAHYQFRANEAPSTTGTTKLAAGTYYLRVDSYGFVGAPYSFKVNAPKVSLAKAVVAPIRRRAYTGKAIEPKLSVKMGSAKLVKDVDYTVSYTNNVQRGTASVTITGIGAYKGKLTTTFSIVRASIAKATVSAIKTQGYTGSAITPAITVKAAGSGKVISEGKSYTLRYSGNKAVGTATITITGMGNFTGKKTVTFKIARTSIAKATVAAMADQAYTGAKLTPKPTIKMAGTLTEGKSYTLEYSDNKALGTATITIKGVGNYTGTKKVTFNIVAGNLAKASVSKIADQAYTGKAVRPEVEVRAAGSGKLLNEGKSYTVSYKNNKARGTASVTITGMGNFTGTKTVTFKIV